MDVQLPLVLLGAIRELAVADTEWHEDTMTPSKTVRKAGSPGSA